MKLNKKGFTLIELLAVVVILLVITTIAITSISAAIERNKVKQNDAKKEIIVSYAKLYYQSHKNSLETQGCLELGILGLSEDEITDANGEVFTGFVQYTNGINFEYVENCS